MKRAAALSNLLQALALIGSVVIAFNGLAYSYRLVKWGFDEHWHFTYVSGWGFPFLAHLEYIIPALLLIAPYWLFVRARALARYKASRTLINAFVAAGLLLFALASVLESWLAKSFP
ncbi:hypothetical protein NX773_05830 [Massilia solisilvae]|uniref:Uncharacterized protein n=1 Tax=Massilia solisilvae TaxID=1811225 RepID=A0ABT2BGN6_9BURK|nr:hypothetical protein [Massilia solisilvae]MCS0607677.1 hypothetical protein [Massilia solisilvae]